MTADPATPLARCLRRAAADPEPAGRLLDRFRTRRDDAAAVDAELAALPAKYREPLVLCELEGRPRRVAAAALGVPEGTLSSRLATGKRMLADRLRRRGFAAGAGVLGSAGAAGAVPP